MRQASKTIVAALLTSSLAGRDSCTWTSWWEIAYLTMQVGSMNTMVVAVAYSCTQGAIRRALITYSLINFLVHLAANITGAPIPNRFMISFELLVLFATPTRFIYFAYLWLGITPVLWEQGIWFSENDVLHLFVMLWVLYLGLVLVPKVSDYPVDAARLEAKT